MFKCLTIVLLVEIILSVVTSTTGSDSREKRTPQYTWSTQWQDSTAEYSDYRIKDASNDKGSYSPKQDRYGDSNFERSAPYRDTQSSLDDWKSSNYYDNTLSYRDGFRRSPPPPERDDYHRPPPPPHHDYGRPPPPPPFHGDHRHPPPPPPPPPHNQDHRHPPPPHPPPDHHDRHPPPPPPPPDHYDRHPPPPPHHDHKRPVPPPPPKFDIRPSPPRYNDKESERSYDNTYSYEKGSHEDRQTRQSSHFDSFSNYDRRPPPPPDRRYDDRRPPYDSRPPFDHRPPHHDNHRPPPPPDHPGPFDYRPPPPPPHERDYSPPPHDRSYQPSYERGRPPPPPDRRSFQGTRPPFPSYDTEIISNKKDSFLESKQFIPSTNNRQPYDAVNFNNDQSTSNEENKIKKSQANNSPALEFLLNIPESKQNAQNDYSSQIDIRFSEDANTPKSQTSIKDIAKKSDESHSAALIDEPDSHQNTRLNILQHDGFSSSGEKKYPKIATNDREYVDNLHIKRIHKRSPQFPNGPPRNRGPPNNRGPPDNRGPPKHRGRPENRGPPNRTPDHRWDDFRGPPEDRGPAKNRGEPEDSRPQDRIPSDNGTFNEYTRPSEYEQFSDALEQGPQSRRPPPNQINTSNEVRLNHEQSFDNIESLQEKGPVSSIPSINSEPESKLNNFVKQNSMAEGNDDASISDRLGDDSNLNKNNIVEKQTTSVLSNNTYKITSIMNKHTLNPFLMFQAQAVTPES